MGICKDGSISCSICTHEFRTEIDRALVMGDSMNSIQKKFHVSYQSLRWHKEKCRKNKLEEILATSITERMTEPAVVYTPDEPYEKTPIVSHKAELAITPAAMLQELCGDAREVLAEVKEKGDHKNYAPILNALIRTIEAAMGRVNTAIQVNNYGGDFTKTPEYAAVLRVCREHPEVAEWLAVEMSR